ncbi:hypothetical protein GGI04_002960 [Coemansia thaxteri]|uniref:DUF7707 domain-containing protein n=1 Tax=Coemansia thaxteri TaxID=2663907 RepID=A0A9W8BGB5_9FUNG|nr:hypothetical protein H4R26_004834 [Coemansia thaxteri]KAJ2003462.1 hypothetical protein GGI04_002960 [Coemansia thaxteri]KAJ2470445.1 hypothetical protein GGI02_002925 [Coemansia sp. RSA 2322]KAJ2476752.1 hypothetical protein EV174_004828 [Coemansia sp. RSA 2320]
MLARSYIWLGIAAVAVAGGGGPQSSRGSEVHRKRLDDAIAAIGGGGGGSGVRVLRGSPAGDRKKRHRALRTTSSGFDPDSVDIDVKITWCNDNSNFCNNVCLNMTWGAPINDGCDASSLQWHCTCGNGKNPDPDVYTFPVMHYQCQYEVYQCQNNCATGDIRCTQECQGDRNCTAPKDPNAGKTAVPESDVADGGLDTAAVGTDPVNFFSAASVVSTGGYVALTALVAASLHLLGMP